MFHSPNTPNEEDRTCDSSRFGDITKRALKRFAFLFIALFSVSQTWAMDISKDHSGSWYNQAQSGHGFSIEVLDFDLIVIYWYTYNPDGTSTFLLTVGEINGNSASGQTYYYSGMRFGEFDNSQLNEQVWGTSTITFHDCDHATFSWNSFMTHNGVPFGSGSIEIQRLLTLRGAHCAESPVHDNYAMNLISSDGVGFGHAQVFSNGYTVYLAASDVGAEVGVGQITLLGSDEFSYSMRAYDMIYGGYTNFSGRGTFGVDGIAAEFPYDGLALGFRRESFDIYLSLDDLAGQYVVTDALLQETVANITVNSNGVVTGQTSIGCDLSGEVWVPNWQVNQFVIDVDETCASVVNIVGAGYMSSPNQDYFVLGSDGEYGYAWSMSPQN